MPGKVSDILIAARSLVDAPEKWTKGLLWRPTEGGTAFCAAGAICTAIAGDALEVRAECLRMLVVGAEIDHQLDTDWNEIVDWNNDRDRTHAEIVAAFDCAISAAMSEEAVT